MPILTVMEIKRVTQPLTVNPSTEAHDQKERRDADAEEERKRKASVTKAALPHEHESLPTLSQMPDSEKVIELLNTQPPSEIHQIKRLMLVFSNDKKRNKKLPTP